MEEIIAVLPGMKSPTIMPLAQEGWCSVHTVLDEKRFWEIIGKLKGLGAEGILVLPIEKNDFVIYRDKPYNVIEINNLCKSV